MYVTLLIFIVTSLVSACASYLPSYMSDRNNNGVWDYMDQYIAEEPSLNSESYQATARQVTITLQRAVEFGSQSTEQALMVAQEIDAAYECMFAHVPDQASEILRHIEAKTMSPPEATEEELKKLNYAYIDFNKNLFGQIVTTIDGEFSTERCY